MSDRSFYFDIEGSGTGVFLGPTESALMELAWRQGDLTVKRALALLGDDSAAYTTVMTVLSRLAEKGLLRREKDGRSYRYRPTGTRTEFIERRVQRVQHCLRENFPDLT